MNDERTNAMHLFSGANTVNPVDTMTSALPPADGSAPQGPPTRIFIVDDHTIVRDGLRARISVQSDMKIVGEAGSVRLALTDIRALQTTGDPDSAASAGGASASGVDVVIMDVSA